MALMLTYTSVTLYYLPSIASLEAILLTIKCVLHIQAPHATVRNCYVISLDKSSLQLHTLFPNIHFNIITVTRKRKQSRDPNTHTVPHHCHHQSPLLY